MKTQERNLKEKDELKKAHRELKTLFEEIDEVLFSVDMIAYKVIQISSACEKVYGYTPGEFLSDGNLWQKVIHPDDSHIPRKQMESLSKGEKVNNQYRIIRKDKGIRWIENKVTPTLDDSGRLIRLDGITNDISERKKAEEELERSFSILEATIESTADGILVTDADRNFVRFNNRFTELLKIPADMFDNDKREKIMPMFLAQLSNPENQIEKIQEIYTRQNEPSLDLLYFKDGRILERYSAPYLIDRKNIGRVWTFRDVTERKTAEEVLLEKKNQLIIAAQIAKLGYWEYDVMNDTFIFNDQFYAIFRTTAEKMGGYKMTAERYSNLFVYPDDRPVVGKEVGDAIASRDPNFHRSLEHRMLYDDGSMGYISVNFYIVKDENGRTIKTYGVNQDITERKRVEDTLRISESNLELKNKELALKNKELEQFAYVASHDLQEPLRTISSFAELFQQQYENQLDEKADKYLHFIKQSADRMKALIKDILDYSRIGRKTEKQQVDCNSVLREVLDDLDVAVKETKAEIKTCPLPSFCGYPTEMKQLFQNLIFNAIKFKKKDGIPQINIYAKKKCHHWEFSFRDNGIGIDEDHHERIFIIFQRLHSRSEYDGSGIGLAHCKKIVELHGGKIWVKSTPDKGSTFYFTISENID